MEDLKTKWLTEPQTQAMLGCKRGKLWLMRKNGQLHYSKIGRHTLYHLPSIVQLLQKNSTLSELEIANLYVMRNERSNY